MKPGRLGGSLRKVAMVCAVAACAHHGESPQDTVGEYARAIRDGHYDRAYDLMAGSYRRTRSRAEFIQYIKDNAADVRGAADKLLGVSPSVELRAHVDYGEGERLPMLFEAGGWHLAEDPLDLFGQRTPREAVRSFVRAIERRRYDIVLRFIPKRFREGTTAEQLRQKWEGSDREQIQLLIHNLRAHLQDPIEEEGDEARMPYGNGMAVRFVREEGLWRIQDPD